MSEQVAPPPAPDAAQPQPGAQVPPPVEEPAKKSGRKKMLGIVGAVVAFLVIAGLKFGVGGFLNQDETADAKAGDCIAELPEVTGTEQEEVDGAKVVECTSTEAAYTVVGRVDGQTEAQAETGAACDQFFKEGQEGYVFSAIEPGKTGYLLCLTKKA
ncbi:LppU/SCO3897 family protein [Micromonospora sp. H33]|uniref:LppU/SCO3897 family protein n=1 Tax=Micromonospora sp. H33 TaxID=3452215 RepID=UPI003F8A9B9C